MSADILGKTVISAEAWSNIALRPQKPEGSLGRKAQDGHLDSHTAPELWRSKIKSRLFIRFWLWRVGVQRLDESNTFCVLKCLLWNSVTSKWALQERPTQRIASSSLLLNMSLFTTRGFGPTWMNLRSDVENQYMRARELCESRGGRPGLPSLISLWFLWT